MQDEMVVVGRVKPCLEALANKAYHHAWPGHAKRTVFGLA
jgi:hypothetical protein